MLYSEKLRPFAAAHPCRTIDVDGAQFRYILTGKPEGRTRVFLNGGMNTLEMWMDYVDALMHDPKIAYVSGGHLSTVLKTEDYIRTIRAFLAGQPE